MHSGPACVLAYFFFPFFRVRFRILSFFFFFFLLFLSFLHLSIYLWVSAREFEREDRRIQDAWMRKVVRREPVPCDSFVNPCQWKTFLSVYRAPNGGPFFFFFGFVLFPCINCSSRIVKFMLYLYKCESRRVEVVSRAFHIAQNCPSTRQISARLRVWASRESIHLASENNAHTRQLESQGTEDSCLYSNSIECL